jgi:uncharacterized hydrophobic protein (TIGR00341 family)
MSAQRVEIFLPEHELPRLETVVRRHCRRFWRENVPGENEKLTCLVQRRYTERLINDVEASFVQTPELVVIVSNIEASIPPILEDSETLLPTGADQPRNALERWFTRDRLSTDELYDDIETSLRLRPAYLITVLLSSLIAGLGMRSGQTAVVIGAMVIAPLLGPTMGMAMAATVGDSRLGQRALVTLSVGAVVAIIAGILVGVVFPIDPNVAELRTRTFVQPADIALALACGLAGVLAFSRGASLALVGVMIAVALVPPLSAIGIFLARGDFELSAGGFHLFAVNLVCVNVAGIAAFLFQGLPPRNWRITGGIMLVWLVLLVAFGSLLIGPFAIARLG